MKNCIKSVHPFPARMAPSIVWERLHEGAPTLKILDPMAGSGTTLTVARSKGHIAYGIDRDPLAVIISKAWCADIDKEKLICKAEKILDKAKKTVRTLNSKAAYPAGADKETKRFVTYWFDLINRKQLTALSKHISLVRDNNLKNFLWTSFSRMIITKKVGVSLGMDISHSRPHKVYKKAPVTAFEIFTDAVGKVAKANPFSDCESLLPEAIISYGDCRCLDYDDNFFDLIITSPPYLNAIDYMRGHKLSLVWMRNCISRIRKLRATNIGAEIKSVVPDDEHIVNAMKMAGDIGKLTRRQKGFFVRYVVDMESVCSEIVRVLKPGGTAIFVIGDSTINGVFISNSKVIENLFEYHGLKLGAKEERTLSENRRYLPPPSNKGSGKQLQARIRKEVILTMKKDC
ncbi:MAG: hypothetical protein ACETWQ_03900 [Phycisphaerae bacterium]